MRPADETAVQSEARADERDGRFRPSPSQRRLFWAAAAAAALAFLYLLRSALLPFIAGAAVAYFLDPVAAWLERRGLSRTFATIVVTALIVVGLVLGLLILIPLIQTQLNDFAAGLPDMVAALHRHVEPVFIKLQDYVSPEQAEKLRSGAGTLLRQGVQWGGELGRSIVMSTLAFLNVLSLLVIAPVVAFYLLRDWNRLVSSVDSWLPRAFAPQIRTFFRDVDATLAGFLRGQATLCLIQAAYYALGLSILGVYPGFLVGVFSGFLSFIPYVGSIGGFAVSLLLAFLQFDEGWRIAAVAGLFGVGQLVEGTFLSPLLVGGRVGLHPVWVMFALLAGGTLFGFVGILLAVPVAAVIGVLARILLAEYLRSDYYAGFSDASSKDDV